MLLCPSISTGKFGWLWWLDCDVRRSWKKLDLLAYLSEETNTVRYRFYFLLVRSSHWNVVHSKFKECSLSLRYFSCVLVSSLTTNSELTQVGWNDVPWPLGSYKIILKAHVFSVLITPPYLLWSLPSWTRILFGSHSQVRSILLARLLGLIRFARLILWRCQDGADIAHEEFVFYVW